MQRAMARQAEAERERRAKVIAAEGEFQAAERLKDAAAVISETPIALQLRYLQTLIEIGSERTTTISSCRYRSSSPDSLHQARRREVALERRAAPRSDLRPARRPRPRSCSEGRCAARPVEDELEGCPFCAGREDRTPPETLRLPPAGPWRVRVAPNLYPAVERQEVVVHTPEHLHSIAELADDQLALVAEAWRLRAQAAHEEGFAYVHALVNEGREAGSSLPHTHSQLAWLRGAPPVPAAERHLATLLEGTKVIEQHGLVLLCPRAGRGPYEMLVAPVEPASNAFESPLLSAALQLAAEGLRRLRTLEPGAALNLWLHDTEWWHLELLPRLTVLAGLELGAGIYVNTIPPEVAAERLRA